MVVILYARSLSLHLYKLELQKCETAECKQARLTTGTVPPKLAWVQCNLFVFFSFLPPTFFNFVIRLLLTLFTSESTIKCLLAFCCGSNWVEVNLDNRHLSGASITFLFIFVAREDRINNYLLLISRYALNSKSKHLSKFLVYLSILYKF